MIFGLRIFRRTLSEDRVKDQRGVALFEALVSIVLFAIIGLGFTKSLIFGYKMRHRMIHRSTALQVASDEMERQTRLRANNLVAGTTTTTVSKSNMQFQQVVTISSVAAGGFDVSVVVTDLNSQIGGSIQLQNKLVPYGSS